MATFDFPSALKPAAATVQLNRMAQTFRSPFGGSPQVGDVLSERWMVSLLIPPALLAASGAAEALATRLAGGYNRVRVEHPARPEPMGSLHGSPTLYASIGAGATSLVITGGSGANLLLNAGLDTDANSNGVADNWTNYTAGTSGTITRSMVSGYSGSAQRHSTTSLGTTTSDHMGSSQDVTLTVSAGASVCASGLLKGTTSAEGVVNISFFDAGAALISSASGDPITLVSGTWQQAFCATTVPAGAVTARIRLFIRKNPSAGSAVVDIDEALFEENASEPGEFEQQGGSLLAGDILGLNGQWLQVAEDASADANGRISVTLVNRVRDAVTSGAAIEWSRPTIEMASSGVSGGLAYAVGANEGLALDLEEVW